MGQAPRGAHAHGAGPVGPRPRVPGPAGMGREAQITPPLWNWEDLELGERLRRMNVRLLKCPDAVGYHWHPALSLDQIPRLIEVEGERARMGLVFYRKHPTRRVRFIIQFTWMHRLLWELLTLGGLLNERSLRPLLRWLLRRGYSGVAMELLRLPLNCIGVRALFREARREGLRCPAF